MNTLAMSKEDTVKANNEEDFNCPDVRLKIQRIVKKGESDNIYEIICYNTQKLCQESHYFKTYVRNACQHVMKEEEMEGYLKHQKWLSVQFGDEVNWNALRWINEWIHEFREDTWSEIDSLNDDNLFEYLVTANFLQIDSLENELSRRVVKSVNEMNFIVVWYKSQAFNIKPVADFIQQAFINCGNRKRITRYGPFDLEFKVCDLSLKCHTEVYKMAVDQKKLNIARFPKISNLIRIDITPEVSKLYASTKKVVKHENVKNADDIALQWDKIKLSESPSIRPEESGYLMEALYLVVNWLYIKELPLDLDNDVLIAIVQIASCMNINDEFMPFIHENYFGMEQ